jgi:hypothetical protein
LIKILKTMEAKQITQFTKFSMLVLVMAFISSIAISQTDTTAMAIQDTTNLAKTENSQSQKSDDSKKEKKKKTSVFTAYAGVSFNQLSLEGNDYTSSIAPGWLLGAAYKHGRFFYWQVGARFNNAVYELQYAGQSADTNNIFSVRDIDVPLTAGLNLLYFTGKALGLRIYVSAIPGYVVGVGGDNIDFNKDNINSFNFYGQGGLGFDFLFLSIDAGYNYGFTDVSKIISTKPGQVYVNLGFRF